MLLSRLYYSRLINSLTVLNQSHYSHVTFGKRFLQISSWYHDNDSLETNPYFKKYSQKIKTVKEVEDAHTSGKIDPNRHLDTEADWWKYNMNLVENSLSNERRKSSSIHGSKLPHNLSEVIHMDLLESRSSDDIGHIWMEHFKAKDCVSGIISEEPYDCLMTRAKDYPMFLYPLPRSNGYEFILSQFSKNRCYFTSLINYQTHGEEAPWQLCLTFYNELVKSKGIALMTSEIDLNTLNIFEAQFLVQLQKMFYTTNEGGKFELVSKFKNDPVNFNHMDLIKEIEGSDMVMPETK